MNKFRVWDKKEQKMYYDDFMIGTDGELYRLDSYSNNGEKYIAHMLPAEDSRYIIMRGSERCDSKREFLYESDIVEDKNSQKYEVTCEADKEFRITDNSGKSYSIDSLENYTCVGNKFEQY